MSKVSKTKSGGSGITGYVYTATSITIKYTDGNTYRYDVSKALSKEELTQMIRLAESGSGLNSYINTHRKIRKYGYVDDTLPNGSFNTYGK